MPILDNVTKYYSGIINWGEAEAEFRVAVEYGENGVAGMSAAVGVIAGDAKGYAETDLEEVVPDGE